MPRQTLDITRFDAGIIALPDAKDIPMDAASWSLDVDVDTAPGRLTGRWTDLKYETSATKGLNASLMRWVQKADGTYTVVYYQPSTDQLRKVEDFHNASTGTDSLLEDFGSTARTVCAEKMNNTLHIGMGTGADSQWFGEIDTGQFGGSAPSGFQYKDAELAPPTYFPKFHKVVRVGTKLYGIEWLGNHVWEINTADWTWRKSVAAYINLQAICLDSAGTGIWVFENTGIYGRIIDVDLTSLGPDNVYVVGGWGTAGTLLYEYDTSKRVQITDMETTTSYLWIIGSGYFVDGTGWQIPSTGGTGFFFKMAIASMTTISAIVPTDVSPTTTESASSGDFNAGATYAYKYGPCPLWRSHTRTELGIVLETSTVNTTDSTDATGLGIMLVKEAAVAGDKFDESGGFLLVALRTAVCPTTNAAFVMSVASAGVTDQQLLMLSFRPSTLTAWQLDGGACGDEDRTWVWRSSALTFATQAWGSAIPIVDPIEGGLDSETPNQSHIQRLGEIVYGPICDISSVDYSGVSQYITFAQFDGYTVGRMYGQWFIHVYDDAGEFTVNTPTYHIISPIWISLSEGSEVGTFTNSREYFYRGSFFYDGMQESPLMPQGGAGIYTYGTPSPQTSIRVDVRLFAATTNISTRVTDFMIYRADGPTGSETPEGYYRKVQELPMTESIWGMDPTYTATWGESYLTVFEDIGNIGASYETSSGIMENLETTTLNYQYSTQVMGYHFVGYVANDLLTASKRMVVRSKQNAFDMFDWTTDFLYMPRNITAMGSFGGSLLVFAQNEVYKVNPQGMYIEDTYTGIGCLGPLSLAETEAGLFFCDLNNIYVYDGSKITPIGDPIKFSPYSGSYSYPWTTYGSTYTRVVIPMNKLNSVLFCACKYGEYIQTYVFHIPSKTWRFWNIAGSAAASYFGGMTDKDGYAWISHADFLWKIAATSGTRSAFTWYSRDFDFGDASQPKMIDGIQVAGTDGSTKTISSSGAAFATLTDHSYHDSIILKIVGIATTNLQSISILYRPMASKSS